jgi:hypothetical protein
MAAGRMARRESLLEPQDAASPRGGPQAHSIYRLARRTRGDQISALLISRSAVAGDRRRGPQ